MAGSGPSDFSLSHLTQHRLKQVVFEGLPKDRWYALVLDPHSTGVLSSHMRMNELLDYNVTVVEDLTKTRKEGQNAVYLIAPLSASINRVIDDFQRPKPMYDNVYLFFTSKLPEKMLTALKSCTPLVNRLKALKEVHSEFWGIDSHCFHTGQPNALVTLFGEDIKQASWEVEAAKAAHRLSTLFTTLKSYPGQIYVRTPNDLPELPLNAYRARACQFVGERVRDSLNSWKMKDPTLFTGPQCELLIIDRGADTIAPIIHPFHYGAAIHDMVPLEDNFVYKHRERVKGTETVVDVLLNESDPLFCEWRHRHVGEVGVLIGDKTAELSKSKTAQLDKGGGRDMGRAVQGLPEYTKTKQKLEINTTLINEIFAQFDARDLRELGRLEQGLVYGEFKSKDIINAMQQWNAGRVQGQPTTKDKMRLLLTYLIMNPGKLEANGKSQWQDIARISSTEMHAICNVRYLGVELSKIKSSGLGFGAKRSAKGAKYKSGADSQLENDRFRPMLMELVDSLVSRKLTSLPNFSLVTAGNEFDAALAPDADSAPGAVSVRSAARHVPTWQRNVNKAAAVNHDGIGLGERIVVVYVLGGYTWLEVQAAHELSQQHKIQVILGGTNVIHNGEMFLQDMLRLSPLGSDSVEVDMMDDD